MRTEIKPPTVVRRFTPKAKTEIGDTRVAAKVRLDRMRTVEIRPPTVVRRFTPKAKTEIGDTRVAAKVRLDRMRTR